MLSYDRERLRKDIADVVTPLGAKRSSLMPVLQAVQAKYGFISDVAMQEVADAVGVRPVEVQEVVSFYHLYKTAKPGKFVIRLCQTLSCDMNGKQRVARQLESELGINFGETTKDGLFTLEYTSCMGMCDQGPALMVNDRVYARVTAEKVHRIVAECRRSFGQYETGLYDFEPNVRKEGPILQRVTRAGDALKKALERSRLDVISEMRAAGLRGRGGAGFPTATKWQLAAAAQGEQKYVVCNADEGEPGTFKDRLLLMEHAELMFEGMTIAGYAIGASKGMLYLRGEYTFMRRQLEETLAGLRKSGRLGKDVLGKNGFSFDIEIRMGAGAYVCGEETALIESLEGKRGEPRNRPPFPVNTGFEDCPTSVNNVETFVDACLILDKGGEWFKSHGTEKSTGTKLFSISGDCERPGIYELPMGITIAALLEEVGGKDAKAVQVGGASGACVPARDFNRSIAFEDIPSGGSIMILGPNRDMLDVVENFLEFFVEESCGQCLPCRQGGVKLLEGVRALKHGGLNLGYVKQLQGLGRTMQLASKCGLGQSVPNAFLSITENFKDEIFGR